SIRACPFTELQPIVRVPLQARSRAFKCLALRVAVAHTFWPSQTVTLACTLQILSNQCGTRMTAVPAHSIYSCRKMGASLRSNVKEFGALICKAVSGAPPDITLGEGLAQRQDA